MSSFSVYMSFPKADGTYDDFIDVSDDVVEGSLGSIKQSLEANEYDVGKITFGSIKLVMRNETSKYSEAINVSSIFPFKRDQTIVKIEWSRNNYGLACGFAECGNTFLSGSKVIFKGLLEDNSTSFDVDSQEITFMVLSMDSIVNKVNTPYSSLSVSDDAETLLYKILNQTAITKYFTVDASNISVSNNFIPDSIASLENTTCLESIQEILKLANAIMFVKDDICYVRTRDVDATSSYVFYGPSSDIGIENIHNISKYNIGLNRCFNYWVWKDDSSVEPSSFSDSIEKYGQRKKEIESDLITDSDKRKAVLNDYLNEFGFPAIELTLKAPMFTEIVSLTFLNKINIDYPSDVLPAIDEITARYGQAIYGEARYATTVNSLFIPINKEWKVLNISINPRNQMIEFKLREVL